MTTARLVPVTVEMDGDELDAEDAWHAVRRLGLRRLLVDSFVRFRYGDGFSSSRALALQSAMAVVPFVLALTGLAFDLDAERPARLLALVVEAVSPGSGQGDALAAALEEGGSEVAGEVALAGGLLLSVLSMTTAVAQVERGGNRIYGIRRDRPALAKYGRAAAMTALLAAPVGVGFVLLVGGGALADGLVDLYGWDPGTARTFEVLRWPAGLALLVVTIAVLFDHAPRRRQPGLSWLALGSGLAVVMTLVATGLLATYVRLSPAFGDVYGPLAGIVALLAWTLMTSVSLFYGLAVCAQLEAAHAGDAGPAEADPGRPHGVRV
ncbi:YihY/virulence factor BrkB family protein [Nocardioides marmoraquaticus]